MAEAEVFTVEELQMLMAAITLVWEECVAEEDPRAEIVNALRLKTARMLNIPEALLYLLRS